ncbi:hypothetical protein B5M44_19090 [Shinella sumterensis]|uniref:hypothetical protein n=1 Tax=Shinella sumterensis TaxID=1967501 RepID=UPI00106EEDF1|nr:hypothetical protein [Shinella sumterensis]MCD1266695.1 hypothetical protein [Shinella sumterensis]TFE96689.1 hypothetical protein B5M44_19090 [Shinella sumterensis]
MSRVDHERRRQADRQRRQGTEGADELGALFAKARAFKKRPAKADLRAEAEAAIAKVTREMKCDGCGHEGTVTVPASRRRARLRCSQCGGYAT